MRGNERLLAILTLLGERSSLSLTDVADGVELPKSTALRFLRSLESHGWVVRDGAGQYSLGPAVVALAGRYLSTDALITVSSTPMRELRDELDETVSLSRVAGHQRVCVQEHPSLQNLRLVLGVGQLAPLHAGASGLLLLAHVSPEAFAEVVAGPLVRYTAATITTADGLQRECELIRQRGWALTQGQKTPGGLAIAVPVRQPGGDSLVSALGVFGPEMRCATKRDQRRWLEALLRCANRIEALLLAGSAAGDSP